METGEGQQRPATTASVIAGLGPASPAFRIARGELVRLYDSLRDSPALHLRVGQWQKYIALVYGDESGDEELFLRHTYLATVARLLASARLGMGTLPSEQDLEGIIRGDYFQDRAALANFVEEDFFTWPLLEPVRQEGLDLARRLLNTLQSYDFSQVREDVLKELYQGLVDPEARHDLGEFYTPDWLAELMLRDELGLDRDPHRSVLDPSCGSGTFLFIAVRLMREALEREGMATAGVLRHILENVVGMDVHPLAVTIARTNYLLALGDLLQAPRGEVTIPVYLADAMRLPELLSPLTRTFPSPVGEGDQGGEVANGSYALEAEENVFLQVPQSLAMNPAGLDYLLPFMKNKYGSSILHVLRNAGSPAAERAWAAFRQFLVTPSTSRKPFALDEADAGIVVQTQRVLVRLMEEGKDTLWFFMLRNALRPAILERSKFDVVLGNPPWLSFQRFSRSPQYLQWLRTQVLDEYRIQERSAPHLFTQMELATLFFARTADLYLKDGGSLAFVMPRSVMVAQQHAGFTGMSFKEDGTLTMALQQVLDLEGVTPLFNVPACVLVAHKGPQTAYPVDGKVLSGGLLVKDRPLAEAREHLEVRSVAYERVEGRLVADAQPT